MKAPFFILALAFATIGASCAKRSLLEVHESVMEPGMTITATNKQGTITVTYMGSTIRKFEADGQTVVKELIPRSERFVYDGQIGQGILGLYDPADAWWFSNGSRWIIQEAQRHFKSSEDVQRFLVVSRDYMDWIYTDNGLVVGFGRDRSRGNQYNVEVYQIYINGKKPDRLIGSRSDQIHVRVTQSATQQ